MNTIYLVIDLFAGAGGTTTGFEQADYNGCRIAEVVACVNHDPLAIASHSANHRNVHHFIEDIRTLEVSKLVQVLNERIAYYTARGYDVKTILWASLECTNFSNAKGGKPRDADSRTLAEHLYRYIEALNPDYVKIENVREFMAWGPLVNGKPEHRTKGRDFLKWVETIKSFGYEYDFRLLNSADYGAHTSRVRYFGCFAKHGEPIIFPTPTHAKNPDKAGSLFGHRTLRKWKAVKEVLDFNDEGKSIFNRKTKLSEKSLSRIYQGLISQIAGGQQSFILKYNSMNRKGVHVAPSVDNPCPVVSAQGRLGVVNTEFLTKYYSSGENIIDVNTPASTLTTKDRLALIQPSFLANYYSGGGQINSIDSPAPAITTVPKTFLVNPSWGGNPGSTDAPCFTIIARMDKAPPYLVVTEQGQLAINIEEGDSEYTIKIKEFMALYGIVDIKMRMLKVPELLKIQGFPDGYILKGNSTDQKRFIGNAVVPVVPRRWVEAMYQNINQELKVA